MRYGFTTGSCSAAAAKAAAYMLLTGRKKDRIRITTPKGIDFVADLVEIYREEKAVTCGVIKDGGDDPDVTTGALVLAKVFYGEGEGDSVRIEGGIGVGRVTKPGLDQPVGNAAINSVPRAMIIKEVKEVMEVADFHGSLSVEISVPSGQELAASTFNPRLGIQGGISILGTSGVVEPMSQQALLDTIRVELSQKKAMGRTSLVISPGNYGLDFMKTHYQYDLDQAAKCSNFIGQTLDMIGEMEFERVLLCGHIGKLIKVSGGIMNTHSREGDCRMELMAAAALRVGLSKQGLLELLDCVSTDAGLEVIAGERLLSPFMDQVMTKIDFYLKKRVADRFSISCMVYSNAYGLLGSTPGAEEILNE